MMTLRSVWITIGLFAIWRMLVVSEVLADESIGRLPAIETNFSTPPLFHPPAAPVSSTFPNHVYLAPSLPPIPSQKEGLFQRFSFTTTWLAGDGAGEVGVTELDLYATFALPAPTRDHPLLLTPGFEIAFFNGPLTPDLPGQVYSAYLQMLWIPRISPRWTAMLGVNPGVYSDFQDSSNDPFRLRGRAVAMFDWWPDQLQLLLGLLYLDRDDVNMLPTGGVVWTPNDDIRFDLLFPQPKLAYRFACCQESEDWVYLAGEFGGDTWAIQRAGGVGDRVTMRDLRLILGVQRKLWGGAGMRLEIGYVFGRTFEYRSATPDLDLSDTLMLRGGVTF